MRHKELKNNDSIGTVNFENCVFACEETVTISKSNHGAGKIEATIMLPEQELKNLLERCHNWSITEEQEEKGILGTVSLLVDVKIKNVSISILLDGNDNPSEYTEIPLKSEETAQIFSFMNETCKNQFGKGIHDMMKEFRKGKKTI